MISHFTNQLGKLQISIAGNGSDPPPVILLNAGLNSDKNGSYEASAEVNSSAIR